MDAKDGRLGFADRAPVLPLSLITPSGVGDGIIFRSGQHEMCPRAWITLRSSRLPHPAHSIGFVISHS